MLLEKYLNIAKAYNISGMNETEIIYKANKVLNLYNHGMKNIVFPNIDKILNKLLNFNYKAWFFRVKDILYIK